MKKVPTAQNYSTLVTDFDSLIEQGRRAAVRYVNTALVATYWMMGKRIVYFEQKGKERAEYGEALLKKISDDLPPQFGKGFTERNLEQMRQLYISYQKILNTPCAELEMEPQEKVHTVCAELAPISQTLSGISETSSRKFPLSWSHYRLDLLFYHRILRWLVATDLKIGEFSHADAGQMNLYVNYLKDKEKLSEENDPVGIILCTDKKKTVVEYALGGMSNKIFASKYRLQLPDPEVLKTEIEHEKQRLIEMNIVKEGKKSK